MEKLDEESGWAATPVDIGKYERSSYETSRVKLIKELIPEGAEKEALDIGCGPGYFTEILRKKGWLPVSIDTDSENIRSARKYATEVHLGDAISVLGRLPSSHYCLACAFEIIEHMSKANGSLLLRCIHNVLSPGGILLISTPNKFSLEGLGGYCWGEKIRNWGEWKAWDDTHVHIYTSGEFIGFVREHGFVLDQITGYWYSALLPFGKRLRLPLASKKFPFNRLGFNLIIKCHKT